MIAYNEFLSYPYPETALMSAPVYHTFVATFYYIITILKNRS